MVTILCSLVMLVMGFKLGRKYQDFQDLMLARRVSKLVGQREQLSKEQDEYEKYVRQDKRLSRLADRGRELEELEEKIQ